MAQVNTTQPRLHLMVQGIRVTIVRHAIPIQKRLGTYPRRPLTAPSRNHVEYNIAKAGVYTREIVDIERKEIVENHKKRIIKAYKESTIVK